MQSVYAGIQVASHSIMNDADDEDDEDDGTDATDDADGDDDAGGHDNSGGTKTTKIYMMMTCLGDSVCG